MRRRTSSTSAAFTRGCGRSSTPTRKSDRSAPSAASAAQDLGFGDTTDLEARRRAAVELEASHFIDLVADQLAVPELAGMELVPANRHQLELGVEARLDGVRGGTNPERVAARDDFPGNRRRTRVFAEPVLV